MPTRETSTVVKQIIDEAASSLLLISYASYRVPWLIAALDAAHTRGVHVRMLLESAPGIHAADAFTDPGRQSQPAHLAHRTAPRRRGEAGRDARQGRDR